MPDSSGIGTRSTRCMPKTPIRSFLSCIIRMHGCPHYYGAHTLEYSTKPYALPEAMSSDSASSMGLVRSASLNGHGHATLGPVPPGDEHYDPTVDRGSGYDPVRARKLLDEAGWPLGEDGVRQRNDVRLVFECVCQDDSIHRRIATGVCDHLE